MCEILGTGLGECCCLSVTLALLITVLAAAKFFNNNRRKKLREEWAAVGKDVVVLHILPRSRHTPNLSPYVFKLETFLRYAKIPYKVDHKEPFGSKGLTPWITLNGEEIADSELITLRLTEHFNVKEEDPSDENQAVTTAFTVMMDYHFNWGMRYFRYLDDRGKTLARYQPDLPWYYLHLGIPLLGLKYRLALHLQGFGSHTYEQVILLVKQDLQALSLYLGKKPYLCGDKVSRLDSVVFAHLANFVHNYSHSPFYPLITEMPNLLEYVKRLKKEFWPDWDQCLLKYP